MKDFETIMTIITSILAAIVIGLWILTLGEFAVMGVTIFAMIVIVAMLQPNTNTIIIEIEAED